MAANVETMFYFGKTPWHGLGTKVEHALTSTEALQASGLDWVVEPRKIYLENGNLISNFNVNVRNSDNTVLGMVTDRYKIVQNSEAFSFTDALIGEGAVYETAGSLSSGKRVWLLAKLDKTKVCGDDVIPYLVFTNSFDGSGAVKVAITPIRVVCQNTLTLALKQAERTWSMKHTQNVTNKLDLAKETLFSTEKYMEYLKEQSEKYTEIVFARPEVLEFLSAMFPITEETTDRQRDNIETQRNGLKRIYETKDDISKFRGTVYGMIEAVADYEPHAAPLRATKSYQENNFLSIVDGGKNSLMERACAYFG